MFLFVTREVRFHLDAPLSQGAGPRSQAVLHAMRSWRADRAGRITLGSDKGYDAEDFVNELRSINVAQHVAAKANGSAIDGRTTRQAA
jgi:hypothetical protein